jgi:5-methylcytosine-specific restriction protein A
MSDDKTMSFSAFCQSIGFPLKNIMWSWAAMSDGKDRALFTIWEDEIASGEYPIWHPSYSYAGRHGAKERRDIAIQVIEQDLRAYGIVCIAKDPKADVRKRIGYDSHTLLKLQIMYRDDEIIAKIVGEVKVSHLGHDTDVGLPSASKSFSALEDIVTSPLGNEAPDRASRLTWTYSRNSYVRAFVLKRAKGKCEYCGQTGFQMPSGERYVETHHVIALADQGADTIENVIALCPNHHREAHYGVSAEELEKKMIEILERKGTSDC